MPDDPAQIVRFWHAVEMFSPKQLPKTDARNHVADRRLGDPMPWEPAGKLDPPEPGKVWRHEVFGGVYDLSKIRDVLVQKYGQDDPEAPTRGQSALFACTVLDALADEAYAVRVLHTLNGGHPTAVRHHDGVHLL
jgi:hypothetical protein